VTASFRLALGHFNVKELGGEINVLISITKRKQQIFTYNIISAPLC
jgi:hypothetical protein